MWAARWCCKLNIYQHQPKVQLHPRFVLTWKRIEVCELVITNVSIFIDDFNSIKM